jgi:type I restriction enzyme, R subunit
MAERARAVQESFEERQTSTAEALAELLQEVEGNESARRSRPERASTG